MSLPEIQSLISQLPRSEEEELLRSLAGKLSAAPAVGNTGQSSSPKAIDRDKWIAKLKRLQSLTDGTDLRRREKSWTNCVPIGFDR